MADPKRIQRRRTGGWRMLRDLVFRGMKIGSGTLEQVWIILEHAETTITGAAKGSPIFGRGMAVIPTQPVGATAYCAPCAEKPTFPISRFVQTPPFISFWHTPELLGFAATAAYSYGATNCTFSGERNGIYLRETMAKYRRLATRLKIPTSQFSIVAGNAKSPRPGWLTATMSGTKIAITFTWGGCHG